MGLSATAGILPNAVGLLTGHCREAGGTLHCTGKFELAILAKHSSIDSGSG